MLISTNSMDPTGNATNRLCDAMLSCANCANAIILPKRDIAMDQNRTMDMEYRAKKNKPRTFASIKKKRPARNE